MWRCFFGIGLSPVRDIIIHAFITCASSVMILNQKCWQSLCGPHGKDVDGLFEKVSF